jgi:Mg/Co/Ni transporter MgtE
MARTNTLIKFIQEVRNEGESYRDANFHKNRKEEIIRLLAERRYGMLIKEMAELHAADAAELFEEIPTEHQTKFFRLLPKELASDVFVETDTDTQERLIKAFTDKELKEVIDDMFLDDTVDIIEEMPANVVKRILKSADPENRKQINAQIVLAQTALRESYGKKACATSLSPRSQGR